jgi:hypothetical protein
VLFGFDTILKVSVGQHCPHLSVQWRRLHSTTISLIPRASVKREAAHLNDSEHTKQINLRFWNMEEHHEKCGAYACRHQRAARFFARGCFSRSEGKMGHHQCRKPIRATDCRTFLNLGLTSLSVNFHPLIRGFHLWNCVDWHQGSESLLNDCWSCFNAHGQSNLRDY